MAKVHALMPGDLVENFGERAVFIEDLPHPLFAGLRMVIWRLDRDQAPGNGTWSHDALSIDQDVGDVVASTANDRERRLRAAILDRKVIE